MGYETRLIFIEAQKYNDKGKPIDYCRIEATLEMGKICYNAFGKLIEKLRIKSPKELNKKIIEFDKQYNELYNTEGDYTDRMKVLPEKEADKIADNHMRLSEELRKQLPFIFDNPNHESFTDNYGDLLIISNLEELYTAILQDQARSIKEEGYKYGYRRYNVALKMIYEFMNEKLWDNIQVVLWGH